MSFNADVLCLSHLRWGFVFQRPNHLMSLCARERRVFFVEEPIFEDGTARVTITKITERLRVCTPHIPVDTHADDVERIQQRLIAEMVAANRIERPLLWFYTPMALAWVHGITPSRVVYDCMDELSAFRGAPPALQARERELMGRADVVFTGGHSLYEAKRRLHPHVFAFPSSVDTAHFAAGRTAQSPTAEEPADQKNLARPRVGFFGVIDERIDLNLLEKLADARPGYSFVLIGPVVKIDSGVLPRRPNLHYLGHKSYSDLPRYIADWDVAMMPFALNESTQFISPTKTLEYLAAHKPVVSTHIRDVASPYGEQRVVHIADASTFAAAVDEALKVDRDAHATRCEEVLATTSWERTWRSMWRAVVGSDARASSPEKAEKCSEETQHV